jgi:hypothetical protein
MDRPIANHLVLYYFRAWRNSTVRKIWSMDHGQLGHRAPKHVYRLLMMWPSRHDPELVIRPLALLDNLSNDLVHFLSVHHVSIKTSIRQVSGYKLNN